MYGVSHTHTALPALCSVFLLLPAYLGLQAICAWNNVSACHKMYVKWVK